MTEKKAKILILFSKRATTHLQLIKEAIEQRGEAVCLANYGALSFRVDAKAKGSPVLSINERDLKEFKVIFFRTMGKHWEEVNLITTYLHSQVAKGETIIIDPIALRGRPYLAMKAWQMLAFSQAGLPVPRTIYGSLIFLEKTAPLVLGFPLIIKRSEGARGERVFLANNKKQLRQLINQLEPQEKEEGKRFLAQEFIPNKGDLRILVLGNEILGAIKRVRQRPGEFRNNVSRGGRAFAVELSPKIAQIALQAAKITHLSFAGVDIVLREGDNKPFIFEVNRAPQFKGFARATGIDVPDKIARYLINLKRKTKQ